MKRVRERLNDGPDLTARKVIMTSMCYYGLNISLVTDAEYDAMCQRVAKLWSRIDETRQWQLGTPEAIRTSGYRVKVTLYAASAAVGWLKAAGYQGRVEFRREWRFHKQRQVRWLYPEDFKWIPYQRRKREQL